MKIIPSQKLRMISSSWFEFSMTEIGLTVPPVLVAVLVSIIKMTGGTPEVRSVKINLIDF